MQINVLNEKAREAIHNAVQAINPFDQKRTQVKVNMGVALEMKAFKSLTEGNRSAHVYAGTASPIDVAKRRAKNKVARKSRKANR
jgi:hypothetical protein